MSRQILKDKAFILVALKVKQTPKLIALPLSDTQVGTKTNKQTNKRTSNFCQFSERKLIFRKMLLNCWKNAQ